MKFLNLIKQHLVLTYGLVGFLLYFLIELLGVNYDDSGVRGIFFWGSQIFVIPYWAIMEVLFMIGGGKAFPGQFAISIIGGLTICIVIDIAISKHKNRS